MKHAHRLISHALALFLAVTASSQGKLSSPANLGRVSTLATSSNDTVSIIPNTGACMRFISVFVPAHGGEYVVGVSFAYWDMNGDGQYTPGVDKLNVCVNCADACGWGP
jgi:hypothetical protein